MGAAWLWWAAECYGRRVPPLRVVIADDSLLIREGVSRVLVDAGLEVVGRAGDGEELLGVVAAERPDVVVVDIRMPPTHTDEGVRAAREIRPRFPGTGVLVLSQYAEPEYVVELIVTRAARSEQPVVAPSDMERVMLEHAVAWAREHLTGVAREVGSEFVAVLPDGQHSRHARFHEALAWLEAHGSTAD